MFVSSSIRIEDKNKEETLLSTVGHNAVIIMKKTEEAQELEKTLAREEAISDHTRMEYTTIQQSDKQKLEESKSRLFLINLQLI